MKVLTSAVGTRLSVPSTLPTVSPGVDLCIVDVEAVVAIPLDFEASLTNGLGIACWIERDCEMLVLVVGWVG